MGTGEEAVAGALQRRWHPPGSGAGREGGGRMWHVWRLVGFATAMRLLGVSAGSGRRWGQPRPSPSSSEMFIGCGP